MIFGVRQRDIDVVRSGILEHLNALFFFFFFSFFPCQSASISRPCCRLPYFLGTTDFLAARLPVSAPLPNQGRGGSADVESFDKTAAMAPSNDRQSRHHGPLAPADASELAKAIVPQREQRP